MLCSSILSWISREWNQHPYYQNAENISLKSEPMYHHNNKMHWSSKWKEFSDKSSSEITSKHILYLFILWWIWTYFSWKFKKKIVHSLRKGYKKKYKSNIELSTYVYMAIQTKIVSSKFFSPYFFFNQYT